MVGIYLVVLFVLNSLVFKPTLRLIEERGNQTGVLQGDSEKLALETESLAARYEKQVMDARREAVLAREKIVSEARKEESLILSQARAEGDKLLAQMRATLNAEREAAKVTLNKFSTQLARDMTSKVLEKSA